MPLIYKTQVVGKGRDSNTGAWSNKAACRGQDIDKWFKPKYGDARKVCKGCPVARECLAFALRIEKGTPRRFRYGLWGGKGPEERWQLDETAR